MAKRCPKCGTMNDDEMVFCGACTEPLNEDVKLVMRVDEMAEEMKGHHHNRPLNDEWEEERRRESARMAREEREAVKEIRIQKKEKEGGSALPMILLGIVAAVAIVFLLK